LPKEKAALGRPGKNEPVFTRATLPVDDRHWFNPEQP